MQISLFQRYKAYINSLSIGETYTTDDLYDNVGRYESETMWKRWHKQRMYRTATYQTYLKRLGALEKIKRGKWKVLHHIPEWFYSKHANYLLGYSDRSRAESLAVLEASGCPDEAIASIYIPEKHRINPFKSASKIVESSEKVTIDVELLKELYKEASQEVKDRLQKDYPSHFETYFDFGQEHKLSLSSGYGPLIIAQGVAPNGDERKCLLVRPGYELRTKVVSGYTFLYFVDKR